MKHMKTDKILELTKKFIEEKRIENEKFVPGETYVRNSGAVWDEEDVVNLVKVALEGYDRSYTDGKYAYEFERLLATALKQRYVTLCNSGSSANLLAISALMSKKLNGRELKKGDEVITVAAGFPTTVNPIIQNGLVPVFVDIHLPQYNALPNAIEEAISEKTKAIFIAHTLGNPFKAKEVRELADRNGLWIIADCCDALSATNHSQPLPYWADVSTFSFYPAHHISIVEGGAVSTDSPLLNKIIRSFRDWGRSCFPAGTLINVEEKQIPIQNVGVGDFVISHLGAKRKVVEVMSRKYSGDMYKIKSRNSLEVVCTAEHPFWVKRGESVMWLQAKELMDTDILLEHLPIKYEQIYNTYNIAYKTLYGWRQHEVSVEPDLFRLIGYWLAEGSTSCGMKGKSGYSENKYKFYRVEFAFHEKEKEYIKDVSELMKRYFGSSSSQRTNKNSHGISLSFKSRKGYEFFRQFFGAGACNKSIPDWIVGLSSNYTDQLIKGYWRGDGSSSKTGYNFSSSSPHLASQIRRILSARGIVCSHSIRQNNQHAPSVVNGKKVVQKHPAHFVNIYGESAIKFGLIVGENQYKLGGNNNKSWFDENYEYHPIDKIESNKVVDLDVYNLEVEEDHSYHANGIAVHNCWCATGKDNTCGKRYGWELGELPYGFDHKFIYDEVGYNLKTTDLQAAMGIGQLKRLPKIVEARRDNWEFFRRELNDLKNFFILPEPTSNSIPSWFGFMLTVKENAPFSRRDIVTYLEENKIGSRMLFAGNLTKQPAYKDVKFRVSETLKNTDIVMNQSFWFGVFPGVTNPMREYVVEKISEFCKGKK